MNREDQRALQLLYALMRPTRQKIIRLLRNSKEPLYIRQIAEKIGESERNVSFHMATLAEYGFVDGEYRVVESGHGAKFYRLTPQVDAVLKELQNALDA